MKNVCIYYLIPCPQYDYFCCRISWQFRKIHYVYYITSAISMPTFVWFSFFFLKFTFFYLFIYLFMTVLSLRFCARAFSSCGKWGPLFSAVREPLTIAASLVAEHRLQTRRLSNCGSRAQLLRGMWESSQTRARTRVPCIGRQILNHCATREALCDSVLKTCP